MAQLVGASLHRLKVCRFEPQSGCIWEAANRYFSHIDFSLSLSLSLSLSFPLSPVSEKKSGKGFLRLYQNLGESPRVGVGQVLPGGIISGQKLCIYIKSSCGLVSQSGQKTVVGTPWVSDQWVTAVRVWCSVVVGLIIEF